MVCRIIGVGGFVPGHPISNEDLSKIVIDSDPDWVKTRTGIEYRHFAGKNTQSSDMAYEASIQALNSAGLKSDEVDLIIVCTTSPDNSFPSTATKLQGRLGCKNSPSFDLQAVCAGFVYGLETASNFIASGKYKNVLLVGVDKMSALLDMEDRSTAVLFGDGAGAVILQKSDDKYPITEIHSDGSCWDILHTSSDDIFRGTVKMNGKEVYKHAVEKMGSSMVSLLEKSGLSIDDIAYIVPHQANERIIDSIATKLSVPEEKLVKTISKYANNSAATIPLALWDLEKEGKLKKGDLILMTALGGGLTWGSALLEW